MSSLPRDSSGRELKKIPAPPTKHLHLRCHCHQFHASIANGSNCPWRCIDPKTNKFCGVGKCEICKFSCSFVCSVDQSRKIKHARDAEKNIKQSTSAEEEAMEYLKNSTKIREAAVVDCEEFFEKEAAAGRLDYNINNLQEVIGDQASLVQARDILLNPPNYKAYIHFDSMIRRVEGEKPTVVVINGKSVNMRAYKKPQRLCRANKTIDLGMLTYSL